MREKKYFFSDAKSHGPQFSKVLTFICVIIAVVGCAGAAWAAIALGLAESIVCALIGAAGCIGVTSIVWMLKKSQAENTMRLFLESYKELIKMKQGNGQDCSDLLSDMENKITGKMESTIDTSIDESISPIEKQGIY